MSKIEEYRFYLFDCNMNNFDNYISDSPCPMPGGILLKPSTHTQIAIPSGFQYDRYLADIYPNATISMSFGDGFVKIYVRENKFTELYVIMYNSE